jgi:hypothetical protein
VGLNEALFREVNERIEELTGQLAIADRTLAIVCECGDAGCTQQLVVGLRLYERVRSRPDIFIIAPGHELPDVEDIVESGIGYAVVRKHAGVPADIAERTDPRGPG